jgi:hypothetical protein
MICNGLGSRNGFSNIGFDRFFTSEETHAQTHLVSENCSTTRPNTIWNAKTVTKSAEDGEMVVWMAILHDDPRVPEKRGLADQAATRTHDTYQPTSFAHIVI